MESSHTYQSATEIEAVIAQAWRRVLELAVVDRDDSFFELGGDSVRMSQVREVIESELQIEIGMVELFECPTIRSLTKYIVGEDTEINEAQSTQQRADRRAEALAVRRRISREDNNG